MSGMISNRDLALDLFSSGSWSIPYYSAFDTSKVTISSTSVDTYSLRTKSVILYALLNKSRIEEWCLKSDVLVQVERGQQQAIALTYLAGVLEYGCGQTDSEAIRDLIVSLGEYRQSLESQEPLLGESSARELSILRDLIEHC